MKEHQWAAEPLSTLTPLILHPECLFLASVGLSDLSLRRHLPWEVVHESQLSATIQVWSWLSGPRHLSLLFGHCCSFSLGITHTLSYWFLLIWYSG